MSTYKNSKKAWRQWFERSEFQTQLQTENLAPGANTRDITIQGQGIYTSCIILKFTENVTGTGVFNAGADDPMDEMIQNFRIKSSGKLTEQIATAGHILTHLHHIYLDEPVVVTNYIPAAAGAGMLEVTVKIPCAMQSPFNVTMLSNLGLTEWTAAPGALTLTSATCQINVVSTDVPPPLIFAFASQTITLPTTGSYNVTTLVQGFLRESLSLLNYTCGQVTQLQYILDDGRNCLYADALDTLEECSNKYQFPMQFGYIGWDSATGNTSTPIQNWYDSTVDWQSPAMSGEQVIEVAYMSGGKPMPWGGAGRFVVNTVGLSPATLEIVEILIAQPVGQQLAATNVAQPTSQRPRTDLAAGGQTATGPKPRVKY